MAEKTIVEINVDIERLKEEVEIDEFIAMQEGELRSIRDVLGMFVVNGSGGYLDKEEGQKIVGKMTINQLLEANKEFMGEAELAVVPKGSKGD